MIVIKSYLPLYCSPHNYKEGNCSDHEMQTSQKLSTKPFCDSRTLHKLFGWHKDTSQFILMSMLQCEETSQEFSHILSAQNFAKSARKCHVTKCQIMRYYRIVELTPKGNVEGKWRRNLVCCCYYDNNERQV